MHDDGTPNDTDTTEQLSVGRLAELAGLTARALRHYDRLGILRPASVDDRGHRWYAAAQLPAARLAGRLRAVGVPLDDIRAAVAPGTDRAVLDEVLRAHDQRLESRLTRLRGDRHQLDHLLHDGLPDAPVDPSGPAVPRAGEAPVPAAEERRLAVDLFNGVWRLLEVEDRTPEQDDRMLHMAHASRFHWEQAGTAVHWVRGEWMCSRVYAVLRRPEPALHHADRALQLCRQHGVGDWDLAFVHEARARAHAVAGDGAATRAALDDASTAAGHIADESDRALLAADLATVAVPGPG